MSQCEHEFLLDHQSNQVKCIKCGDLDDEMQLFNQDQEKQEEKDDFDSSQVNFE